MIHNVFFSALFLLRSHLVFCYFYENVLGCFILYVLDEDKAALPASLVARIHIVVKMHNFVLCHALLSLHPFRSVPHSRSIEKVNINASWHFNQDSGFESVGGRLNRSIYMKFWLCVSFDGSFRIHR